MIIKNKKSARVIEFSNNFRQVIKVARRLYGGRLASITTTNSQDTLQNLTYTYDSRGNIHTLNDGMSGENSTFAYDSLSRLTSMDVVSNSVTVHNFYNKLKSR
jgi:hypothetical protein